jgi:hypothetical protein
MTRVETKSVLIWGLAWGLVEATLGSWLHLVPGLAGFFMFPIAFFFMRQVFLDTDRPTAVFFTAAIAAGIKLGNLALPHLNLAIVLNPALAILLESLSVMTFFALRRPIRQRITFVSLFGLALGARALYLACLAIIPFSPGYANIWQAGLPGLWRFIFPDSLVNALLIYYFLEFSCAGEKQGFYRRLLLPWS